MQLSRGVQVARPEPDGDDAAGRAGALDERLELGLPLRVDERLDRHVVALARSREQLAPLSLPDLSRGLTPDMAGKDVLGAVLGLLHVRLVEGVDAEDGAGDGGGELPAVELDPEVVRLCRSAPRLPGGPRPAPAE